MSSIDVIVPCYRYGQYLREAVESVLSQPVPNLRVLIIDDASPDNTADVAGEFVLQDPRVSCIRHAENKGHIYTYNEGIAWAAADYLLLLSADDYLLPGALWHSVKLLDEHPQVGFTFGTALELSNGGGISFRPCPGTAEFQIMSGLEFIELSGARNLVPTATAVVRTKLQQYLGGYRPELPHSGDMEMWLRFAAHASVGMVLANQAVYRRHGANMSDGYTCNGWLLDLEQRRSALDWFLRDCNDLLSDPARLRCSLMSSLARCAVGLASSAFNASEVEASARLREFALAISPDIKRSAPWIRLALKSAVGPGAWTLMFGRTGGRTLADTLHRKLD